MKVCFASRIDPDDDVQATNAVGLLWRYPLAGRACALAFLRVRMLLKDPGFRRFAPIYILKSQKW